MWRDCASGGLCFGVNDERDDESPEYQENSGELGLIPALQLEWSADCVGPDCESNCCDCELGLVCDFVDPGQVKRREDEEYGEDKPGERVGNIGAAKLDGLALQDCVDDHIAADDFCWDQFEQLVFVCLIGVDASSHLIFSFAVEGN